MSEKVKTEVMTTAKLIESLGQKLGMPNMEENEVMTILTSYLVQLSRRIDVVSKILLDRIVAIDERIAAIEGVAVVSSTVTQEQTLAAGERFQPSRAGEDDVDENDPTPTERPPMKVSVQPTPQPAAQPAPPPSAQPQQVVTPIKAGKSK